MKSMKRIAVVTIGRGFGSVEHYLLHLGASINDTTTTTYPFAACHIPKSKTEKVGRIFRRAKIENASLEFREVEW